MSQHSCALLKQAGPWRVVVLACDMLLRLIGYWSSSTDARYAAYPDPASWVDHEWDDEERSTVGWYVRSGSMVRGFMGYSTCRLCGFAQNGNHELTDGTFIWPEGLAHYVMEHSVRLPEEFVRHVEMMEDQFEAVIIDTEWWRTQAMGPLT